MRKRILVTVVLITLLIGGIVPQAAFAAEEEESGLSELEQRFVDDMESRIATARKILAGWREILGNISKDPSRARATFGIAEVRGVLMGRQWWENCGFGGVPIPFGDIAELWNDTVCNDLAGMVDKFHSITDPNNRADEADFFLGLVVIRATVDEVETEVDLIEVMVQEQAIEVAKLRKAQEEERKREEAARAAEREVKKESDCFIATAAYGTPAAKEIDILRQFRDDFLRDSSLGNGFINFYYQTSPPLADFIAEHEALRTVVRTGLVDPVVAIVAFTRRWWE
ncbi:CFI-box-CTERM domain-containing protein [Chloroflexota bacterium]